MFGELGLVVSFILFVSISFIGFVLCNISKISSNPMYILASNLFISSTTDQQTNYQNSYNCCGAATNTGMFMSVQPYPPTSDQLCPTLMASESFDIAWTTRQSGVVFNGLIAFCLV